MREYLLLRKYKKKVVKNQLNYCKDINKIKLCNKKINYI